MRLSPRPRGPHQTIWSAPVSPALALLIFIVLGLPYSLDVAFCEDLYNLPISQAALTDAEKVSSYHASSSFSFLHVGEILNAHQISAQPGNRAAAGLGLIVSSTYIPPLLISRPPPSA